MATLKPFYALSTFSRGAGRVLRYFGGVAVVSFGCFLWRDPISLQSVRAVRGYASVARGLYSVVCPFFVVGRPLDTNIYPHIHKSK